MICPLRNSLNNFSSYLDHEYKNIRNMHVANVIIFCADKSMTLYNFT
jgi:hypothetical protein